MEHFYPSYAGHNYLHPAQGASFQSKTNELRHDNLFIYKGTEKWYFPEALKIMKDSWEDDHLW
jgi:hypothetical protein